MANLVSSNNGNVIIDWRMTEARVICALIFTPIKGLAIEIYDRDVDEFKPVYIMASGDEIWQQLSNIYESNNPGSLAAFPCYTLADLEAFNSSGEKPVAYSLGDDEEKWNIEHGETREGGEFA